jgi:glycosyltransferase involved in cell wall biosynthesis
LRTGNRDYYRLAYPREFFDARRILIDLIRLEEIEVIVAVLERCEEYTRGIANLPRIVDQYDCVTLAHERQLALRSGAPWHQRWKWKRNIRLARSVEKGMGDRCDLITAIAPADVARLQALNPDTEVQLVPNGVANELLERRPSDVGQRRGVAFWGNLSFPVNRQAVHYFAAEVWKPYLAEYGVEFAIIGPNADAELKLLALNNPGIVLAGYVDDLFAYVDQYPIMVNPMVAGAGLKNKVLESFASGRTVVTTRLGVEAFPEIGPDHCCIEDDPAKQASAILHLLDDDRARQAMNERARQVVKKYYNWDVVGASWSALLRKLGGVQLR